MKKLVIFVYLTIVCVCGLASAGFDIPSYSDYTSQMIQGIKTINQISPTGPKKDYIPKLKKALDEEYRKLAKDDWQLKMINVDLARQDYDMQKVYDLLKDSDKTKFDEQLWVYYIESCRIMNDQDIFKSCLSSNKDLILSFSKKSPFMLGYMSTPSNAFSFYTYLMTEEVSSSSNPESLFYKYYDKQQNNILSGLNQTEIDKLSLLDKINFFYDHRTSIRSWTSPINHLDSSKLSPVLRLGYELRTDAPIYNGTNLVIDDSLKALVLGIYKTTPKNNIELMEKYWFLRSIGLHSSALALYKNGTRFMYPSIRMYAYGNPSFSLFLDKKNQTCSQVKSNLMRRFNALDLIGVSTTNGFKGNISTDNNNDYLNTKRMDCTTSDSKGFRNSVKENSTSAIQYDPKIKDFLGIR